MKKLAIIAVFAALAGCNSQQPLLVSTQQVVVMPDPTLFECPTLARLPNPDTLTETQVAKILVNLQSYNVKCKKNIVAIQEFLTRAKSTVESHN